jgi:protein-tyrosine phosphatase
MSKDFWGGAFVKNVMFVCTGNICRSALAEYLLNHHDQAKELGLKANSSGVGALVGHSADPSVRKILDQEGIPGQGHIAQQISKDLVSEADIILVMEPHHRQAVLAQFPDARSKVFLLRHRDQLGIIDPYKKDFAVFEQIHEEIKQGIDEWILTLSSL